MQFDKKIRRLGLIVLITIGVSLYIFRPIYLTNPPRPGLICKICKTTEINDQVAVRLAGEGVVNLAKVVGKPGDQISITNGSLTINQQLSDLELPKHFNYSLKANSEDEFFLVVYNHSMDEIVDYGRVNKNRLIGKVIFLW